MFKINGYKVEDNGVLPRDLHNGTAIVTGMTDAQFAKLPFVGEIQSGESTDSEVYRIVNAGQDSSAFPLVIGLVTGKQFWDVTTQALVGSVTVKQGEAWEFHYIRTGAIFAVQTSLSASEVPSGTVTSVGMSVPADLSVANSPVTTNGTLAVTRKAQPANTFLAGPQAAGNAAPTYRKLVAADLPAPANVAPNVFLAGPVDPQGGNGPPQYRQLVSADLPKNAILDQGVLVMGEINQQTANGNGISIVPTLTAAEPVKLTTTGSANAGMLIQAGGAASTGKVTIANDVVAQKSLSATGPITSESTITGKGFVYASVSGAIPGPTVTGAGIQAGTNYATHLHWDSTRPANGRYADWMWSTGEMSLRFMNDTVANGAVAMIIAGSGAGITSIKSNSGSGSWTHTGSMSVTGEMSVSTLKASGEYTHAALPSPAAAKGMRTFISDGPATPVFGDAAAGGGTKFVPVYCDGAGWFFG